MAGSGRAASGDLRSRRFAKTLRRRPMIVTTPAVATTLMMTTAGSIFPPPQLVVNAAAERSRMRLAWCGGDQDRTLSFRRLPNVGLDRSRAGEPGRAPGGVRMEPSRRPACTAAGLVTKGDGPFR